MTEADLNEPTSGGGNRFKTNCSWACSYLEKALLLSKPRRNFRAITDRGRALAASDQPVTFDSLMQYPEFKKFREDSTNRIATKKATNPAGSNIAYDASPDEVIDAQFALVNAKLADDLLEVVAELTPYQFEKLVLQLMLAMGYGADPAAGFVTKMTGDGGIDGVVLEDRLGFGKIYIQAKQWAADATVGRPELQKFAGALAGEGATKGIFMTTARFTDNARNYVEHLPTAKIVLIDGARLTQLMVENNVGVNVRKRYEIKSIDQDFFSLDD